MLSFQGETHLEWTPIRDLPGGFHSAEGVTEWLEVVWVMWMIPRDEESEENTTVCLQLYLEGSKHGVRRLFGGRMALDVNHDSTIDFQCPEQFTKGHWTVAYVSKLEIGVTHRHGGSNTTQTCCLSSWAPAPSPQYLLFFLPSALSYCCLTFLHFSPIFSFSCTVILPPFKTVYF